MTPTATARRAQFDFERTLRARILDSRPEDRFTATSEAYAALFAQFPEHDALQDTPDERARRGQLAAGLILPLTTLAQHVLEIGCGGGDVLAALAQSGRIAMGIEPSAHMISSSRRWPDVTVSWGMADRLEFPDATVDVVFSQQVLEHLHPDDVPRHVAEAHRVLRPGGLIAIETPNRRTGPQDVSRGFTPVAQGLHLQEWSVAEMIQLLRQAGFVRLRGLLAPPFLARRFAAIHRFSRVPAGVKAFQDRCLAWVPGSVLRTAVAKCLGLHDIFLFAQKPGLEPARMRLVPPCQSPEGAPRC